MKKIKRTGMLILAVLLILCVQISSVAFAAPSTTAPVGDENTALEIGDILMFYVDVTSNYKLSKLDGTVTFDSNVVELIQDYSDVMPYLDSAYEPPQEYSQNANGISCSVSVRDDATDGFDFTNGERFLQFKFKLLRKTTPEIDFFFTGAVSFDGKQVVFADVVEPGTSCETTLQILPDGMIPLSSCDITLDQTHFVYDGMEKQPVVTVKHGAHTLIPGTDYIWAYENNTNVGTASVHVMPLGSKYSGYQVIDFTIGTTDTPLPSVENCEIIMKDATYIYNGLPHYPEITVKDGDKVLTDGEDYILVFSDNVNVGTCTVNICGFFNYVGVVTREFEIISAEKEKTSISKASIAMDKTFSYTGAPITPPITITYNGSTLAEGTDYTLSYENNVEPGTGKVIITGIGSFTDTKEVEFEIVKPQVEKVSLNNCSVTLDKSVFTYDGQAKEPVVTVKHGSTTLAKDTDYTVSYSNNVNAGNGSVTVTGTGNYTDSVTLTFAIKEPQKSQFTWGTDNWNFNNSAPKYFPKSTYKDHISDDYLNVFKNNLTNSEYFLIFESDTSWNINSKWSGSCYGMSSLTLLAKEGLLPFGSFQAGATKLTDLASPVNNKDVSSLITYYQLLQVKEVITQQYRTVPYRSHEENIKAIISALDENTTCIVGFKKDGWGGHAVLAYGYEYGSWTFDGVTYDGCIKICDPNSSTAYNKEANIYFNTNSYNWAIPRYSYVPITSATGAKFNYVGADVNHINLGGYLSGSANNTIENYVARIDANAISDNRTVSKVMGNEGVYMNHAAAPGEIVEDYSYFMGGESQGTAGYNLYDAESAYKVVQDTPVKLDLSIDYEDCFMTASSMAGTSVIFDNEGFVEVKGDSSDFKLSITSDKDHPTSWFTISAEGTGASSASLKLAEDGYILSSDSLKDVSLKALNKDSVATVSFSTDLPSVYIYEINESTIGIKVDSDNNGTYETELETKPADDTLLGDVNLDGKLNVKDATAIQKHLASIAPLNDKGLAVADFNTDGKVNIKDATAIQKKIAGLA